jgi:hypothetical protein
MITCPDCGTDNDDSARFCDSCGRRLDDVESPREPEETRVEETTGTVSSSVPSSSPIADDGLPVGRDLDGIPGGERVLWEGRPSRLWSPRMALMNRYKLTNQRLMVEFGFIGKTTEEVELYRVTDVGVKQHPLERVTNMGDVYIASGDTSTPVKYLHNVAEPERIKDLIREATRQERERRRVLMREDF